MAVDTLVAPAITEPVATVADKSSRAELSNAGLDDLMIWRLSVDQYHAMAMAGILTEDDPVELLEGLLVNKMTKNPPHSTATRLTAKALAGIIPPGWFVDTQEPITLIDSEPEPDIIVIQGDMRTYQDRHPGPQDVGIVVEVADATLRSDQTSKKRIYARAGVPVYWIVNLVEKHIEVYTNPAGGASNPNYQTHQDYGMEDDLPVIIDAQEIGRLAVRELLP